MLIRLAAPASAQAQSPSQSSTSSPTTTGTLRGQVTDPSGAVVANATVAIVVSGKQAYSATTGKTGGYEIGNLPPGKYTVEAIHRKANLKAPVTKEIEVKADGAKLDFTLEVPK